MSTQTETKTATDTQKAPKASAPLVKAPVGPGKREVTDDREIILFDSWETGEGKKAKLDQQEITGCLMDLVTLKEEKPGMQAWECLVIRTTDPLKNVTEDGDVHEVPVGTDVCITANFKLLTFDGISVQDLLADPEHVYKIGIKLNGVKKLKNGHTLRMFTKYMYDEVFQKKTVSPIKAHLDAVKARAIAALPPAIRDA